MQIELRLEGKTVVDADVDLRYLVSLWKDVEKDIKQRGTWASAPIEVDQARAIIRLLDEKTVELIRQIVLGGGSTTWPKVQEICGIKGKDFRHFELQHLEEIRRAVLAITEGTYGHLIWCEDGAPEWDTDDWRDAKLEIDGPALKSLTTVLVG